ncbi:MAG: alanine--tRNA ligase-related protein [Streptosporangiaceae bacterium]
MNVTETTRTFLEFFGDRGHQLLPGSSLLPPDDDQVLFTTAGMHPLTRYLEGVPHPQGRRLAGLQRCLRTTDLDEVGDTCHLTVFQMLGSWSLGDYQGQQSLRWGYQLLTGALGIGKDRLHATVFGGDEQVGPDTQSRQTWTELGIPVELTTGDNWWSNGPTGPCGPDSEIFAWTGDGTPQGTPGTDERWMELWNHVTMRYRRHPDGSLEPLPQPSVDTGMGLERLLMVVQGQRGSRISGRCACSLTTCAPASSSSATASGRPTPAGATCCGGCSGAPSPCCGAATAAGRWATCRPGCSNTPWRSSGRPREAGRSATCSAPRSSGLPGCSPAGVRSWPSSTRAAR